MIFRAFLGEPCPEAVELIEHGHLFHPEQPTNPANGEIEDTDVGFPGPDHVIAERALADARGDGRARAAGGRRRHRRDPQDDELARQLPRARPSRDSTIVGRTPPTACSRSASCSAP